MILKWILIMLLEIIIIYVTGRCLENTNKYKKIICGMGIFAQISMIVFWKYYSVYMPMGVSFYTLMGMGYIIDVYRGKYRAEKNILKLSVFVSYLPAMFQGPICRYDQMKNEFFGKKKFDFKYFSESIMRILWGAMKKFIVANRLSVVFSAINNMEASGSLVLLNVFFYAFYLYCDFSGGIDVAIGISGLFGIRLPENFKSPFLSKSISEYWRRWHITLGTWFRDYVFYPISFSKPVVKISKKTGKKFSIYAATMFVWLLTGLWHGVKGNFIIWGLLNGVIILISYKCEPLYKKFGKRFSFTKTKAYNVFKIVRTFMLMGILRMLDYNTVSGFFGSLGRIFTDFKFADLNLESLCSLGLNGADYILICIFIVLLFMVEVAGAKVPLREKISGRGVTFTYIAICIMFVAVLIFGAYGIGYNETEFIYTQF